MDKRKFVKPSLEIDQQVQFLQQQGLIIEDIQQVYHVLNMVGYYRFSGYLFPFKQPHQKQSPRKFKENITFDYIWKLYQFDSELRLLVSEAIEKIEVAFRAAISNITSKFYDPFWYTDSRFFRNQTQYQFLMRKIDDSLKNPEEVFIKHYLENYSDPKYPPIWMLIETLSFGMCSKLFSNIQLISTRNKISEMFEQHATIIESWMKVMVWIRNLCAHHARLWNRWVVEAPIIPKSEAFHGHLLNQNHKFIVCAYILIKLLKPLSTTYHWKNNLYNLFEKYPQYPGLPMGFTPSWQQDFFWDI